MVSSDRSQDIVPLKKIENTYYFENKLLKYVFNDPAEKIVNSYFEPLSFIGSKKITN